MERLKYVEKDGYMQLRVENTEDLWHLRHVIKPGDVVRADTTRTSHAGEKVPCTLTLDVEKTEYTGRWLRVTGEIREAPEDVERGYHTFNVQPGKVFEIWKTQWKNYELKRVEKAVNARDYRILVCLVEKGNATFATITEKGIEDAGEIDETLPGKLYKTEGRSVNEFYGDVVEVVERGAENATHIILAGPGFERDDVYDRLKKTVPDVAEKCVVQDTSVTGETGLREVVKRGGVEDIVADTRVSEETRLFEQVLEHLNKDTGKVVYGLKPVENAVELGAVKDLLVASSNTRLATVETLMDRVEDMDGEVHILHEDHDPGQRLKNLGGIAAILRYRVD